VPYLYELSSPEAKLRFSYLSRTRPGGVATECVIQSAVLVKPDGTLSAQVFNYAYSSLTAGLLSTVTIGSPAVRVLTYDYTTPNFTRSQAGTVLTNHLTASGKVSSDVWLSANSGARGNLSGVAWGTGTCDAGSDFCCGEPSPTQTIATDSAARAGDGTGNAAGLTTTTLTVSNRGQSHNPHHYQVTDACSGSNACSAGTVQTEWACSNAAGPGFKRGTKDKRDNWKTMTWGTNGLVPPLLEMTSSSIGATDKNGSNALEKVNYTYIYGAGGQQLLRTTLRNSVVDSSSATEKRFYNATSNRLEKVTFTGKTIDLAGAVVNRAVGIFYKNSSSSCGISQPTDSAYDRTLEVDGPCELNPVTADAATACPVGQFPVSVYQYWPGTDTTYNRNRLKSITRANDAACSGPLTVQYAAYDAYGNPGTVIDENLVPTAFTYDADSNVTSKMVNGEALRVTSYQYDNGKPTAVRYPEGNGTVSCYRTGAAAGTDCNAAGTWSPQLQWIATKACSSGASWSCTGGWRERINLQYNPDDGTLSQVEFRTCPAGSTCLAGTTGEVRSVQNFSKDAHQRPTWTKTGDLSGSGSFVAKRGFDPANNLSAIGHAFNAPPDYCRTGAAYSPLCAQLGYDRGDRLARFDEYPAGPTGRRKCFDYDPQGNISRVSVGCSTADACTNINTTRPNAAGTPTTCDPAANDYTYDDFGNVVRATLGNTGAPTVRGVFRAEYDVRGNEVKRQSEAQYSSAIAMVFTYDALDRVTKAERVKSGVGGGTVELYSFEYDTSPTSPSGCVQQPARTKGRVRRMSDPLGPTWFQYDVEGRVTAEIRLRYLVGGGTSLCSGTVQDSPTTIYTYSFNGNLSTITYPHGRQVSYTYGTGALTDRVTAVSARNWNGSWSVPVVLIDAVSWEPFSELRGYQMKFPASANVASLEYQKGAAVNAFATSTTQCPNSSRTGVGGSEVASNDHTGRVRAIWLSSGVQALGGGTGDVYQRTYVWSADQVLKTYSCYLNSASPTPIVEDFAANSGAGLTGYDATLQLGSVVAPNFATTGGPFERRTYSYDARGNRIATTTNGAGSGYAYTYGGTPEKKDWLTQYARSPTSGNRFSFVYDWDGNVSSKLWIPDSSGPKGDGIAMGYTTDSRGAMGPGSDSAYRFVAVNNGSYLYWYDADNRRRRKDYPLGVSDEYFYDRRHSMLEDRGNVSSSTGAPFPIDEYIWLGDRPVAMFKSQFNSSWVRQADSVGVCTRNGVPAACGVYFFVADHLGKPLVTLDSSRRIAGVAEYEPFGHINRVDVSGQANSETQHPYLDSLTPVTLDMPQHAQGMNLNFRAHFPVLDTEQDCNGNVIEGPSLSDGNNPATVYETLGGFHKGDKYSQWWSPAVVAGVAKLRLNWVTVANNSDPIKCTNPSTWPYIGYTIDNYEYRRYQTGATPYFTPLRFPGHYYDQETDFFENWNRYYDPATGRYLQPEPLLQDPKFARSMATRGMSTPSYAYASNNPIAFTDQDGLEMLPNWSDANLRRAIERFTSTQAGRNTWAKLDARPEKIFLSSQNLGLDFDDKTGTKGHEKWGRTVNDASPKNSQACSGVTNPAYENTGDTDPAAIIAHELSHATTNLTNPNAPKWAREATARHAATAWMISAVP
jgi:RHS repeat-associated protein